VFLVEGKIAGTLNAAREIPSKIQTRSFNNAFLGYKKLLDGSPDYFGFFLPPSPTSG